MKVQIENQPKSTIKLTVTVPNDQVKQTYEAHLDIAVEQTVIEGFRKGKAPREMVRDKVGVSKIYGDVINDVLKKYYPQAVKENHIMAIANPKVEVNSFDLDKDLEFTALVAVRPEVKIGDYKKALKDHYTKRQEELSKQNQERIKNGEKVEQDHLHLGTNEILEVLNSVSTLDISDLLIQDETDRMMARLIDQAQAVGLTIDQYLKAQNKSVEQLKKEYDAISEKNLKAEFIMGKIIVEQNIDVTDTEIEEMIKAAGIENVEERMKDQMEKLYVKSILQKNKLLTSLIEEIEGEKHVH